jgi:hypothetical protein
MAKRKRIFPCGHKGYGKACHRCTQELVAQQHYVEVLTQKQTKKQEREASFARDIIDLRGLPDHVVTKARAIIALKPAQL